MLARSEDRTKSAVMINGMFGIGDNIHQRAVLRELMRTNEVWLRTYYTSMYHDLVKQGLHLVRMQRPNPRIAEPAANFRAPSPPATIVTKKISYASNTILASGSILAAQFASVGLRMPERPDYSMPVPETWRERARKMIRGWQTGLGEKAKPILVYRPIVLNKVWECPSRSPDPVAYAEIYSHLRDKFFVVSVADLKQQEWIVGPEQFADVKLHSGQLDFEVLSGMFAEADLILANPGFSPVLAQAVGTPVVVVYGGNESHRTTNSVGDHLTPTLAIEPDRVCGCHQRYHMCDKRITLAPAVERLHQFVSTQCGV